MYRAVHVHTIHSCIKVSRVEVMNAGPHFSQTAREMQKRGQTSALILRSHRNAGSVCRKI